MRSLHRLVWTALGIVASALPAYAVTVPSQFVVESAVPGVVFDTPTAIAFVPGGRMLVAEKRGRVYVVRNGVRHPTPLWSRENEVLNEHDRGLLGIAVDPDYPINRYIYLLYTVDPDSNGTDNNSNGFGRLVRYQVSASDSNALVSGSRTILMGVDWPSGPLSESPSHTIGALRFGRDKSLLVSTGDGAQYTMTDIGGYDPSAFGAGKTDPYEDIGAFRAQYLGSLCGKILRINPTNGAGYSSNPYAESNLFSVRSRVWAYGLRNPFRFGVRPGTGSTDPAAGSPGTVYVGDVGYNTWEETSVIRTPGLNLGWPCHEGNGTPNGYPSANPAHHGCSTIGSSENPALHTPPRFAWHHSTASMGTPSGFIGNASAGGAFYTGNRYPLEYRGAFFYMDYGKNWIRVATMNASDQIVQDKGFGTSMGAPVDLVGDPVSGDLFYVAIATGEVRRIRWTGPIENGPPTASAGCVPNVGVVPLQVGFSSAGSSDPDNDPLTYEWTFGDGQGSTAANPSHTYATPGSFKAFLTVSDPAGNFHRDSVIVIVTATATFPTTPVRDDFNRPDGPMGGAWIDANPGLSIASNALVQTSGWGSPIWNGAVFGPDQEVFVTLQQVTVTSPEHDLMLKVQGTHWSSGHIEVRYDATYPRVAVATYTPGVGWQTYGYVNPIAYGPGDQLGARAYANGTVEVYKNGIKVGTFSLPGWPYHAQGGRIGLTIVGAFASRFENFGGGDVALDPNTPPTATILSPQDGVFYGDGEIVQIRGQVSDAEDPAWAVSRHWRLDLHHNNHVHPSSFVSDSLVDSLLTEEHDDGTGVFLELLLFATDTGGAVDTARVFLYPDVDIRPSDLTVWPPQPHTGQPAEYRFLLRNEGEMRAPRFRWSLVSGGTTLAQGDTLIAAHDSVWVVRTLDTTLPPGPHAIRVMADTLGEVHETSEANNSMMMGLEVMEGTLDAGDGGAPARLELSDPFPNPARKGTRLLLALPRSATVGFSVYDPAGRRVWSAPERRYGAGRWALEWNTRGADGTPLAAGLYFARVSVDGAVLVRRLAILR